MRTLVFLIGCLVVLATSATAQVVINPTTVQFAASADHASLLPDGSPMVTKYEIRHFLSGATSPVQTGDLGKPSPVSGIVTASIVGTLSSLPFSPTQQYVAKVAAIGPTGEGLSAASNPFVVVGKPGAPGTPTVAR